MKTREVRFASIDEYIATFPNDIQKKLKELRATIKAAAPKAEEKISYHMPTFALQGNLVYFSVFKKQIGFFGASTADPALNKAMAIYANEKGSLKFPLDQPLPLKLVTKIVKLRVAENVKRAKADPGKKNYQVRPKKF